MRVECAGEREPCRLRPNDSRTRASRSARFGSVATLAATRFGAGRPRDAIRRDPGAAQVEDGPSSSGVFADFAASGTGLELVALSEHAEPASRLGPGPAWSRRFAMANARQPGS